MLIRVYNSLPDEGIDYDSSVTVHTDGRTDTVPAGTQVRLTPGRVSISSSGCIMISQWRRGRGRCCWER